MKISYRVASLPNPLESDQRVGMYVQGYNKLLYLQRYGFFDSFHVFL